MDSLLQTILKANAIVIYGAHLVALECARWIILNGKQNKIVGFAVTDINGNPERLEGFWVKKIEEYIEQRHDLTVIIATPEKYHDTIELYARKKGFLSFFKIGIEEMSKLKGQRLLLEQRNHPKLSFILEEDGNDPNWLNMVKKETVFTNNNDETEKKRHYKFPTLFYLSEERIFSEGINFDFQEDYEKVCGYYQNLHALPIKHIYQENADEIRNVINIYMIFSIWDKARINAGQYAPWIYPIQVGSKVSDRRYGDLFDDVGDNISEQNSIFAEMTGAYWIWKNGTVSKYKGLCHYRRHFIISKEEIMALEQNGVDVVLSTPRYVPGGIKAMFLAETPVKFEVYEKMLCAISKLSPKDKESFDKYMDSCFYYPNNMVLAKKNIYDSYCAWIFPILFQIVESDIKSNYAYMKDRHIAYAAELLTSYYFMKNKDRYMIVVTDYQFYS